MIRGMMSSFQDDDPRKDFRLGKAGVCGRIGDGSIERGFLQSYRNKTSRKKIGHKVILRLSYSTLRMDGASEAGIGNVGKRIFAIFRPGRDSDASGE
jgi:hypothetical protein